MIKRINLLKKNYKKHVSFEKEDIKNIKKHKRKGKTIINKNINISFKSEKKLIDNTKSNNNINNYNKFNNNINTNKKNNNNKHKNNNILILNSTINNSIENKPKTRKSIKAKTSLKNYKNFSFEHSQNISNDHLKKKYIDEKNIKTDLFLNMKDDIDVNIEDYLSTEVDDMDYDDAIKKDKRTFCNYFVDRLKTNQIILNTFCYEEPLKPRAIKILLFILQIDLYFFVNGLFFNEEYVSQVFHLEIDTFSDKFERFIVNCFYAALV